MEYDNEKTAMNSALAGASRTGMPNGEYANLNVLPVGTRLSEFEIIDLIGEGGFGIVYLAYDHSLKRYVAVKEYMPSGLASRTRAMYVTVRSQQAETFNVGLRSFINEARMLAQFDSPSLVKVFRFWEANGTAYMVMPYYDGITLKQALRERRIDPTQEWIKAFLANLCDAICTIHLAKCYHRDIAPDNILLLQDGRPLLLDFGAARQVIGDRTQGPTAILKPGYAPIEQYADIPGLKQGPWTDVYALAAVVYFLITGKTPTPAVSRVVHDDLAPAREVGRGRFSHTFLAALDRALAVRPEHRIQNIGELCKAFGIDDSVPKTLPPPAGQPAQGSEAKSGGLSSATSRWRTSGKRSSPQATVRMDRNQTHQPPADGLANQGWSGFGNNVGKIGWATLGIALCAAIAGGGYWGLRNILPDRQPAEPDSAAASSEPVAPTIPARQMPPVAEQTMRPPPISELNTAGASNPGSGASGGPEIAASMPAPALSPEDERWKIATSSNKASAYESYLDDYPKGRYAAAAKARLDRLQPKTEPAAPSASGRRAAPSEDEETWRMASALDNPIAYESYLSRYPNGRHVAAARGKVASLAKAAPQTRAPATLSRQQQDADRQEDNPTSSKAAKAETAPDKSPEHAPGLPPASAAARAPADTLPEQKTPSADNQLAYSKPPEPKPNLKSLPEPPLKPVPAQPAYQAPAQPAAPSASKGTKTIKVNNQTMTGDFSIEPGTGMVSGKGKIVWDNGDRFDGTLVRGIKEGEGEFAWANGQRYRGNWSRNQPNGKGTIHFANGNRYEGTVRDGMPNGSGTFYFPNGNRYEGSVKDGMPNGSGTIHFANGNRYKGEVKDGLQHGKGVNRFKNGDVYDGAWVNGKSNGQGRYTWANGSYWEGEFRDDKMTENGKTVYADNAKGNASSGAFAADADAANPGRQAASGNPKD